MIRPNPINYSVDMRDRERLKHGAGQVPGRGEPRAGHEGSTARQAGYRSFEKGRIHKATRRDIEERMVPIGSNSQ